MPQTNADRLLNRISALHKSLQLDEGGHISKMERDLMLNYLREFYEIYASGTVAPPAPKADRETIAEPPKTIRPTPAPASTTDASPPASVTAPPAVSVPPKPPAPAHDSMISPAAAASYTAPMPPSSGPGTRVTAPTVSAPPSEEPAFQAPPRQTTYDAPAPKRPTYAAAADDFSPTPAPTPKQDPELDALFEDGGSTSRFGRQPITDLTRCLSINNRILFTRDLFGGDNDLLNTTMSQLNASGSMREARPLVSSLARRFSWTDENKQESAREFIELIRRRYV